MQRSDCSCGVAPPLADRFVIGVAPIGYGPALLLMPFGFHLATDTPIYMIPRLNVPACARPCQRFAGPLAEACA